MATTHHLAVGEITHNQFEAAADLLVRAVCGDAPPRFLLSDNRETGAARELLRCAGVARTGEDDFGRLETDTGTLELSKPGALAIGVTAFQ